jgi:hypothetical protein
MGWCDDEDGAVARIHSHHVDVLDETDAQHTAAQHGNVKSKPVGHSVACRASATCAAAGGVKKCSAPLNGTQTHKQRLPRRDGCRERALESSLHSTRLPRSTLHSSTPRSAKTEGKPTQYANETKRTRCCRKSRRCAPWSGKPRRPPRTSWSGCPHCAWRGRSQARSRGSAGEMQRGGGRGSEPSTEGGRGREEEREAEKERERDRGRERGQKSSGREGSTSDATRQASHTQKTASDKNERKKPAARPRTQPHHRRCVSVSDDRPRWLCGCTAAW